MTGAARADRTLGSMAGIARRVCLEAGWDGLTRAGRFMARGTSLGRAALAVVVRTVVELHVEALCEFRRESFDRRRI